MELMKKNILFVLLLTFCFAAPSYASQPYEREDENGNSWWEENFQQQNSAMCGQTCIYMIARYYGDVAPDNTDTYKVVNAFGYWVTVNLDSYDNCCSYWVTYVPWGLSIPRTGLFPGALSMIEQIKKNNVLLYNERYYAPDTANGGYLAGTFAAETVTTYDDTFVEDNVELNKRLTYITENYLNNGLPVVFLVKPEDTDLTGHYMILVGAYDKVVVVDEDTQETVTIPTIVYVDPNHDDVSEGEDILQEISRADFINLTNYWYSQDRRWNGKWFTLYHP